MKIAIDNAMVFDGVSLQGIHRVVMEDGLLVKKQICAIFVKEPLNNPP